MEPGEYIDVRVMVSVKCTFTLSIHIHAYSITKNVLGVFASLCLANYKSESTTKFSHLTSLPVSSLRFYTLGRLPIVTEHRARAKWHSYRVSRHPYEPASPAEPAIILIGHCVRKDGDTLNDDRPDTNSMYIAIISTITIHLIATAVCM